MTHQLLNLQTIFFNMFFTFKQIKDSLTYIQLATYIQTNWFSPPSFRLHAKKTITNN